MQYDFLGNTRELRNLMERVSVLCCSPKITPADLPFEFTHQADGLTTNFNLGAQLAIAEKWFLLTPLRQKGDSRAEAVRLLGICRKELWER